MKKKMKKLLPAVYAVLCLAALVAAFGVILTLTLPGNAAYAAETEPITEDEPVSAEDDFAAVFKNDILPLLVSACGGILTLLIAIFPYIKLRGKNKSLQGAYTVLSKTLERFKEKEDVFTVENFLDALKGDVIEGLKGYITASVEKIVKDNFVDNSEALNAVKVTADTLCAQFDNLLKAASLAWKEAPGASELLAKSPTSEVLNGYYNKYLELKKAIEGKQSAEIAEVDGKLKELEAYHED